MLGSVEGSSSTIDAGGKIDSSISGQKRQTPDPGQQPEEASLEEAANRPGKSRKRMRHRIKGTSLSLLEAVFAVNKRPSQEILRTLAQRTGEDEHRIKIWFNNRRGKMARLEGGDAAYERSRVLLPSPESDVLMSPMIAVGRENVLDIGSLPDTLTGPQKSALQERVARLQARLAAAHTQLAITSKLSPKLPPFSAFIAAKSPHEAHQILQACLSSLLKVIKETRFPDTGQTCQVSHRDSATPFFFEYISSMPSHSVRKMATETTVCFVLSGKSLAHILGTGRDKVVVETVARKRVRIDGVVIVPDRCWWFVMRAACSVQVEAASPTGNGRIALLQ